MTTSEFSTTILFGGSNRERLVSVASAQHLTTIYPEADLWFWTEHDSFVEVRRDELLAHQNAFEEPFLPHGKPFVSSLDELLTLAATTRRLLLLSMHGGKAENGELALACEQRGIPFTGSGSAVSQVAFHK